MQVEIVPESELDALLSEATHFGVDRVDEVSVEKLIGMRNKLLEGLEVFGAAGDDFRKHDFFVYPHPKDIERSMAIRRRRVFVLGVITKKFLKADFMPVLVRFLKSQPEGYMIDLETASSWLPYFKVNLTKESAKVYSEDAVVAERFVKALRAGESC